MRWERLIKSDVNLIMVVIIIMEKISTGIAGLDRMLKGGLIKGRTYLIKGGPGAGKTILSIQFLLEGVRRGENVLFISLEEGVDEIEENMESLGLDVSGVEFVDSSPAGDKTIFGDILFTSFEVDIQGFKSMLEAKFDRSAPSRLVVDSITMLRVSSKSDIEYRRDLLSLIGILRKLNVTALLTTDINDRNVEDYLVSGVIELLSIESKGRILRGIRISKMRGSDFDETIRPYKIVSGGIEVYGDLSLFEGGD